MVARARRDEFYRYFFFFFVNAKPGPFRSLARRAAQMRKRGERERIQEAGSFFNVSPDIVDRFLHLLSIRKIRRTNSEKIVERSFHRRRNARCETTDKYVASFSAIVRRGF